LEGLEGPAVAGLAHQSDLIAVWVLENRTTRAPE